MQNIKEIPNGNELRDIQARLAKLGYPMLVDGINGPITQAGWIQFKKDNYQADPEIVGEGSLRLLYAKSTQVLITKEQLERVWERQTTLALYSDMCDCLNRFSINTPNRIRHFLAQTGHESGGGRWLVELGTPQTIRTKPSGGFKFRGAGVLQLTHDYNYRILAGITRDPQVMVLGAPYVAERYPCTSAGVWWQANGMNELIDRGASAAMVSRKINTGKTTGTIKVNGLQDRLRRYEIACKVIK